MKSTMITLSVDHEDEMSEQEVADRVEVMIQDGGRALKWRRVELIDYEPNPVDMEGR